jgi:hypothetical protein
MEDIFDTPFDSIKNSYESFSHSLVHSKLWLCERLEQVLDNESIRNPAVNILASWDSLLAFMLLTRRPKFYGVVNAYDIDAKATNNANKLCDYWQHEYPKVYNHTRDINTLDFSNTGCESIFINCSVDQLDNTSWYGVIPDNRLVCLQTTDLPTSTAEWAIKQSYFDKALFTEAYKVRRLIYCDSIDINYGHLNFKRHMMIGIK